MTHPLRAPSSRFMRPPSPRSKGYSQDTDVFQAGKIALGDAGEVVAVQLPARRRKKTAHLACYVAHGLPRALHTSKSAALKRWSRPVSYPSLPSICTLFTFSHCTVFTRLCSYLLSYCKHFNLYLHFAFFLCLLGAGRTCSVIFSLHSESDCLRCA